MPGVKRKRKQPNSNRRVMTREEEEDVDQMLEGEYKMTSEEEEDFDQMLEVEYKKFRGEYLQEIVDIIKTNRHARNARYAVRVPRHRRIHNRRRVLVPERASARSQERVPPPPPPTTPTTPTVALSDKKKSETSTKNCAD